MNDDQALRQQWETLLAAHRALVSAYLQTLGTDCAPLVAHQVRMVTIQVGAISKVLDLPLRVEPR